MKPHRPLLVVSAVLALSAMPATSGDTLVQVSTIDALMKSAWM